MRTYEFVNFASVLSIGLLAGGIIVGAADSAGAQTNDLRTGFYSFSPAVPQPSPSNLVARKELSADDARRAHDAYLQGDYATARQVWEKAAEEGDVLAQWRLGNMYRLGQGVDPDVKAALHYYELAGSHFDVGEQDAARLGVTIDALVRVAGYYIDGDEAAGIDPRPARAFRLYQITATYGHAAAQHKLGLMYITGTGVEANPTLGLKWLILSSRKHHAPALATLGDLYWDGEFVRQDRVKGLMWYHLAQMHGDREASPEIFERYETLSAQLEEKDRAEALKLAEQWIQQYPSRTHRKQ